eukprot:TRINITY_DN286_c0_g1_i1.p1 TRINITY_DN286_c0_g1~~TRINITY_DN286_c0_g1_i1.p1  ORF type:complete len:348 (+),score=74.61 TRINITY_DN286_c0_g1_i1:42-1046(+)
MFALAIALASSVQAHMWLVTPESRGGVNNIGGTGGPCPSGVTSTTKVTQYEAGSDMVLQFRVNQHGPGPFTIKLAHNNLTSSLTTTGQHTVLASGLAYTVTAGSNGFNGFQRTLTLPSITCESCIIQLSGMAQSDGSSPWYNCASVKLYPNDPCYGCMGTCTNNQCKCDKNFIGTKCNVNAKDLVIYATIFLQTSGVIPVSDVTFATTLADSLDISVTQIDVPFIQEEGPVTEVGFTITAASDTDLLSVANLLMSKITNGQLTVGYVIVADSYKPGINGKTQGGGSSGGSSSNAGGVAAAVIITLLLVGGIAGTLFYFKRNPAKFDELKRKFQR